jgi:hypothetical protein
MPRNPKNRAEDRGDQLRETVRGAAKTAQPGALVWSEALGGSLDVTPHQPSGAIIERMRKIDLWPQPLESKFFEGQTGEKR